MLQMLYRRVVELLQAKDDPLVCVFRAVPPSVRSETGATFQCPAR